MLKARVIFLKENPKGLKANLKSWNVEVFGWINLKVDAPVKELNEIGSMLSICNGDINSDLMEKKARDSNEFGKMLEWKDSLLWQKSMKIWFREGDINSRSSIIPWKKGKGETISLSFNIKEWRVEKVEKFKREASNHLINLFKELQYSRLGLDGLVLDDLNVIESDKLEVRLTNEEIKEVIWICEEIKSQGRMGIVLFFEVILGNREGGYFSSLSLIFTLGQNSLNLL